MKRKAPEYKLSKRERERPSLEKYFLSEKVNALVDRVEFALEGRRKADEIEKAKLYKEFREILNIYNVDDLKTLLFSYYPSDKLVHLAVKTMELAYEGKARASGKPYVSHMLRVGVMAAAFGMGRDAVLSGLLHDIVEDSVKRVARYHLLHGGEPGLAYSIKDMFSDISLNFGHRVEEVVRLLTNLGEDYVPYLNTIYQDEEAAKLKLIDKIVNLWELENIADLEKRREKVENTLFKTEQQLACNIDCWQYDMCVMALREVEDWRMRDRILKATPKNPFLGNEGGQETPGKQGHPL